MDTIKIESKNTKIIAHRGLSGIERENTCPAFVAAGNRSYYGIEADVRTTKDGKHVIMHDETTERVSDGKYNIKIAESDYTAIKNIVLPDLDKTTDRQDIRIPLLTEYIKICKKYNKFCILEVKPSFGDSNLKSIVAEFDVADYLEKAIFISFNFENCTKLRKLLPHNSVQWITAADVTDKMIKTLTDNKLDLGIHYKKMSEAIAARLHAHGIKINCWTCDNKKDAEALAEMDVDFITTNILE